MITKDERQALRWAELPEGCIGYDCEGRVIKEGDTVEVVKADELREGNRRYEYCSVGHRGRAESHGSFPIGWFTMVVFENNQSVGCVDYHLRLVTS